MRKHKSLVNHQELDDVIVNLTPLIDVIFVVLISFILIAPMLKIDKIALTETTEELSPLSKKSSLIISLKKDGTLLLNQQKVNFFVLEEKLQQEQDKTLPPQIYPDKDLPFGQYQKVKDLVQACGYQEINVVLKPA